MIVRYLLFVVIVIKIGVDLKFQYVVYNMYCSVITLNFRNELYTYNS